MYTLFFIAKNNMKKKKGNVFILFFLIMVSAMILYVSISVLTNLNTVLDQAHELFHGADFLYMAPQIEEDAVSEIIFNQDEVAEYQMTDAWSPQNSITYRESKAAEKNEFLFIFESTEDERTIGILPEDLAESMSYNSILLPYCMKANGSYQEGDAIYLTLGAHEYEFEVAGFVEDPLFSSPMNLSYYKCYLTEDYLKELAESEPSFNESHMFIYQVRLKEGADIQAFDDKILTELAKEVPELLNSNDLAVNWTMLKGGVGMLSQIFMAIMLVFSILLIVIALIIVRFHIRNFIEENMKNIGILEACGYTAKQLRASSILEMFCISVIGTIVGVIAGIMGGGFIGTIQASMIGLSWNQTFDISAAGLSIMLIMGMVLGVTFVISRIYSKITVLSALRGGIHTHNFRKNYLPFEKSVFSVPVTLGCKSVLQEKLKNLTVLFIIMLLSFTCCVGFFLYENFSKDTTNLSKMVGIELGTAWINGEDLEPVGKELSELTSIDKLLYYNSYSVHLTNGENETTINCSFWSEPEALINEMIVEGRLPKYENEIVITTIVSEQLEVKVGDIIYVEGSGARVDYIVCGIDQKINNMGQKAMMTLEGAARLGGTSQVTSLYLYAKDGYTFGQLQSEVKAYNPAIELVDSEKQVADSMRSVTVGMQFVCIIFVIITVGVVTMVVMLLIKTRVVKERKNYGIQKALGFTTSQLISQTILTNLPVDFIGAVLGAIFASNLSNLLVTVCFAFCGIQKCELAISPFWLIITVLGIVAVAFLTAVLSAARIRKIEPVKLLQEDF